MTESRTLLITDEFSYKFFKFLTVHIEHWILVLIYGLCNIGPTFLWGKPSS